MAILHFLKDKLDTICFKSINRTVVETDDTYALMKFCDVLCVAH